MDLATLIGLIGAIGAIITAILMGGPFSIFINGTRLMIVCAGSAAVVLMKYPLSHGLIAIQVAIKAFLHKMQSPQDLIEQCVELSTIARKEGVLGLEKVEIENEFLKRGVQLVVDGSEAYFVKKMLSTDVNQTI